MQVNVGDIVEGKVTGLTSFGAFVKLSSGDVGMVHISEVASTFVKDIKEFLAEGQDVKVKVLAVNDAGKISLSIKQAEPPKPEEKRERFNNSDREHHGGNNNFGARPQRPRRNPPVWQGSRQDDKPQSFEDMMSKFKQASDEKQSALKRAESKRGGYSRRGNSGGGGKG